MPKRSAAEKIEYYSEKIKKLKRKSDKKRRVIIYSSDSEEDSDHEPQREVENDAPSQVSLSPVFPLPPPTAPSAQPPSPSHVPAGESLPPLQDENEINELQVDPELLQALGDAAEEAPVYGPDINKNLAQRWLPILKKGLQTEAKEKLLKEHSFPDNCRLLRAPVLNPEISAAVTEIVRGRDKKLQTNQDQLGLGITVINRAMSILLTGDDRVQAMKILSNGCRILTDLHHTETQLRKKLITPGLDKAFLTVIQDQERDESLFGNALSDKIEASKTIERHGLQIKKPTNPKPSTSNASATSATSRFQGNWSGPPRSQQSNRGGAQLPTEVIIAVPVQHRRLGARAQRVRRRLPAPSVPEHRPGNS